MGQAHQAGAECHRQTANKTAIWCGMAAESEGTGQETEGLERREHNSR